MTRQSVRLGLVAGLILTLLVISGPGPARAQSGWGGGSGNQPSSSGNPESGNFSGEWERLGQSNRGQRMILRQDGDRVRGEYYHGDLAAKISGRVRGTKLRLSLTYDDPRLLERWLPLQVAKVVVGIRSALDLAWEPRSNELKGPLAKFSVTYDRRTLQVSLTAEGGTSVAAKAEPPQHSVFRRIGPATSGPPPTNSPPATGPPATLPPVTGPSDEAQPPAGAPVPPSDQAPSGSVIIGAEEELDSSLADPGRSRRIPGPDGSDRVFWQLADQGDWLFYTFTPERPGRYYLWARLFTSGRAGSADTSLWFYVNGRRIKPDEPRVITRSDGLTLRLVGPMDLEPRKNALLVVKRKQTKGADLLGGMALSTSPDQPPRGW